jgi:nucleoside-diphosphate-sugar epimerase
MKVLIAGCGYVGSAAARLLSATHQVTCLRRNPAPLEGIRSLSADLCDTQTLTFKKGDFDAVIYCASARSRERAAYRAAYVDGLRNVLSKTADEARVLFTSSTSVYAESNGGWTDEQSPLRQDETAQSELVAAERLLEKSPQQTVCLRLSGIYGPERTRFIEAIRSGRQRPSGQLAYTNRIHRDDAAAAIMHVLGLNSPQPTYNVSDSDPCEKDEIIRWIMQRLGIAETTDDGRERASTSKPSELAPGKNKRIKNHRLLSSGFQLRYPSFREGYTELL